MPKYEIAPGEYGFKRPKPIDREPTRKKMINQQYITEPMLRQAESRASVQVAAKWMRNREDDLKTLENCTECLESLTNTVWQTDPEENLLEPRYEECDEHPTLVRDWVYDQMNAMFRYLDDQLDER